MRGRRGMSPESCDREPSAAVASFLLDGRFIPVTRVVSTRMSRSVPAPNVFDALNASTPTAITFASGPAFDDFTSIVPPRVGGLARG